MKATRLPPGTRKKGTRAPQQNDTLYPPKKPHLLRDVGRVMTTHVLAGRFLCTACVQALFCCIDDSMHVHFSSGSVSVQVVCPMHGVVESEEVNIASAHNPIRAIQQALSHAIARDAGRRIVMRPRPGP